MTGGMKNVARVERSDTRDTPRLDPGYAALHPGYARLADRLPQE